MELCSICHNKMARITRAGARPIIEFQCSCGTREASASDSLIAEDFVGDRDLEQKYETALERVVHMPARYEIKQDCPECNMDYMTLVFRGTAMKSEMRCSVCGARAPYSRNIVD